MLSSSFENWQEANYGLILPSQFQSIVVDYIWGNSWPDEKYQERGFTRFFEYYETERLAFNQNSCRGAVATHGQLAKVAFSLFNTDREAAKVVLEQLRPNTTPNERDGVIDLAARIISMVAIRDGSGDRFLGQSRLQWKEGKLRDFMERRFEDQKLKEQDSRIRFERAFNARNMEKMVGFEIGWTSNLADHLRFKEDGDHPVVNVFYFVGFLYISRSSTLYPEGFIEETIKTLSLLLPPSDKKTKDWWISELKKWNLDPCMMEAQLLEPLAPEERRIQDFRFWKERLIILKEAFNEAGPRTIPQWWHDDRKRPSWFWVASVLALMLFLLAIGQVVLGGIQVWQAVNPGGDAPVR